MKHVPLATTEMKLHKDFLQMRMDDVADTARRIVDYLEAINAEWVKVIISNAHWEQAKNASDLLNLFNGKVFRNKCELEAERSSLSGGSLEFTIYTENETPPYRPISPYDPPPKVAKGYVFQDIDDRFVYENEGITLIKINRINGSPASIFAHNVPDGIMDDIKDVMGVDKDAPLEGSPEQGYTLIPKKQSELRPNNSKMWREVCDVVTLGVKLMPPKGRKESENVS